MLALILFVVFGIAFSLFATQNTGPISISFGSQNVFHNIPLYLAILLSVAVGLVFGTIFYFVKAISGQLTVRKLKQELERSHDEAIELTKRVHKLELEITKIKTKNGDVDYDDQSI